MELKIDGMMCNKCVLRVQKGLESIGAENISISLETGKAQFDGVSIDKAINVIEELGYDIVK